jgi:hypothetical protein
MNVKMATAVSAETLRGLQQMIWPKPESLYDILDTGCRKLKTRNYKFIQ